MSPRDSHVVETEGDIFNMPPKSILVHACNCQGVWGAGIAKAVKEKYPAAFEAYRKHCRGAGSLHQRSLPGTCLLIPPASQDSVLNEPWIACLFTSNGYGKETARKPGVDPPTMILEHTKTALQHMKGQVESLGPGEGALKIRDTLVRNTYSCRINGGLFGVPWEDTKKVFEEVFAHRNLESCAPEWRVTIIRPPVQAMSNASEETLLNQSEQTLVSPLVQPERQTRQYPTRLRADLEAFSRRPHPERVTVSPPPSNSSRSISRLLCDKKRKHEEV